MKCSVSLNYLVFFIFLTFVSSAYSQTGMGSTSPSDNDISHLVIEDFGNGFRTYEQSLDNECHISKLGALFVRVPITLYLAHLTCLCEDNLPCEPECTTTFVDFPEVGYNYPDIYLRYSTSTNGVSKFVSTPFKIDLNNFELTFSPNKFTSTINIFVPRTCISQDLRVELLQYVEDDFAPYPIENYTSESELFDASIFGDEINIPGHYAHSSRMYLCCSDPIGDAPSSLRLASATTDAQEALLEKEVTNLQVFPNPFSNQLSFQYELFKAEMVKISIIDIKGQVLYASQHQKDAGFHTEQLQTAFLSSGIYYLEIQAGSSTERMKLVKM